MSGTGHTGQSVCLPEAQISPPLLPRGGPKGALPCPGPARYPLGAFPLALASIEQHHPREMECEPENNRCNLKISRSHINEIKKPQANLIVIADLTQDV